MVIPGVVDFAKEHYNCKTLEGVPLENSGGEGTAKSHWEKLVAAEDLMGPNDYNNPTFSGLVLSFMEGMGWYKTNNTMMEDLSWGEDSGCSLFNG